MDCLHETDAAEKYKILIVDDEEYLVEMLAESLRDAGFDPVGRYNGNDALHYVQHNKVDLILLDVLLPDNIKGFEVAKKIKEHVPDDEFLPIIMISGLSEENNKITGLKYADDYVTKPFCQNELTARVNALLRIRQLQHELLASKVRYQCLYENIPELCISLNRERRITDCNAMFCNSFHLNKQDVIGEDVFSFFHSREHGHLVLFFNSLEPEKIANNDHIFEMALSDKEGNPVLVTTRAMCLGEHETGLYIILAMKDVSLNVKLEREQKLARQRLYRSARLASIGTLASGIAHEMNNPLTAIIGFSDAILHRIDDNEDMDNKELEQYLSIVKSEALRCRDVVDNLSKFSREYESQTGKASLYDCLHSAVSLMKVRAQKKNIQIHNRVQRDVLVNTDAQKIGQVLIHILSNSIDFCDEDSVITIAIEHNNGENGPLQLKICDNGPGIPDDIIPKIFDPFFTTKEVGKGIGLGMSICHRLMEECGGSIDVSSKLNQGTVVTLEIPRE